MKVKDAFECCRECEERVPACHSACEQYLEAEQFVAEAKNKRKSDGADDVLIASRIRAKRRCGIK